MMSQLGLDKLTDEQFYNLFEQVVEEMYNRDSVVRNHGQSYIDKKRNELDIQRKALEIAMVEQVKNLEVEIKNSARIWVQAAIAKGDICLLTKKEREKIFDDAAFNSINPPVSSPTQTDQTELLKQIRSLIDYPNNINIIGWSPALQSTIKRVFFNETYRTYAPAIITYDYGRDTLTGNLSIVKDLLLLKQLIQSVDFSKNRKLMI